NGSIGGNEWSLSGGLGLPPMGFCESVTQPIRPKGLCLGSIYLLSILRSEGEHRRERMELVGWVGATTNGLLRIGHPTHPPKGPLSRKYLFVVDLVEEFVNRFPLIR